MRRVATLLAMVIAAAGVAAGCTGPQPTRDAPADPPVAAPTTSMSPRQVCERRLRLPAHPEPTLDHMHWQLGSVAVEDGLRLNYRVPPRWMITSAGRAELGERLVVVTGEATRVRPSRTNPLLAYALELADGTGDIYRTAVPGPARELPAYVTERRVSLAPGRSAGMYDVHSLVVAGIEHALKLEVRYNSRNSWRYEDVARTIISTAHLVHLPAPGEEPSLDDTPERLLELPEDRCVTGPSPRSEAPRLRGRERLPDGTAPAP